MKKKKTNQFTGTLLQKAVDLLLLFSILFMGYASSFAVFCSVQSRGRLCLKIGEL